MKIRLQGYFEDMNDGSYRLSLFNTKEELLSDVGKTEEEIKNGTVYDDGQLLEVDINVDEKGKLKKPLIISLGE
jgi:hypothetical protein